jgi:hypothetical protein
MANRLCAFAFCSCLQAAAAASGQQLGQYGTGHAAGDWQQAGRPTARERERDLRLVEARLVKGRPSGLRPIRRSLIRRPNKRTDETKAAAALRLKLQMQIRPTHKTIYMCILFGGSFKIGGPVRPLHLPPSRTGPAGVLPRRGEPRSPARPRPWPVQPPWPQLACPFPVSASSVYSLARARSDYSLISVLRRALRRATDLSKIQILSCVASCASSRDDPFCFRLFKV